jgi:DNA primase
LRSSDAQSDVQAVRDATDLVQLIGEHIALRPKGREHVGLCPFHDDRSPSMAVVTHKGNAFYKCHACGAGGDVFDFVIHYHKMDFPEALRFLAERAGITLTPRTRQHQPGQGDQPAGPSAAQLREANALAAAFFRKVLESSSASAVGQEICQQRGISDEMIEAFQIGLAPDQWDALHKVIIKRGLSEEVFAAAGLLKARSSDGPHGGGYYDAFRNRLIFPIFNEVGQPVAFGARKIDPEDEPKYLNSAESTIFQKSRTLYGLHLAKRAIIDARQVIVTEGYTDVIACHQAGVCNVVGTLGTALTRQHAKLLSRLCDTVVLLFDGDEAGQRAADRGVEVFFAEPVDVKICVLPDKVDPDDLLKREGGVETLRELVTNATDALQFKINRFRASLAGVDSMSGRQKRFEQFMQELAQLGFGAMQGVRRRLVITQLADLLGVTQRDIEQALPKARPAPPSHERDITQQSVEHDGSDMHEEVLPASDVVAPVRRRAEYDLLAIVLYEPQVALQPLNDPMLAPATVLTLLGEPDFADPHARRIVSALFPALAKGETVTMQDLLGPAESQAVKKLLTDLYVHGKRLCNEQPELAGQQLVEAVRALQARINHEQYSASVEAFRQSKTTSEDALQAALDLLQQRSKLGAVAGAINSTNRR